MIEDGEVRGIITAKLLADSTFNILDTGGRVMMVDRYIGGDVRYIDSSRIVMVDRYE